MIVANATGCSSIYGGSAPSMPYRKDENGRGVAWANSLFEDNAEFGLGMKIASETLRHKIEDLMLGSLSSVPNSLKALYNDWIENRNDTLKSAQIRDRLVPLLEQNLDAPGVREILELKQYLTKNRSGSSAVTAGLTTSATAGSITCWLPART